MGVRDRLRHAWNVFVNEENSDPLRVWSEPVTYGTRPDRRRVGISNERSIITSIYNRISLDVASLDFRHIKTDEEGRFLEEMKSGLNDCLTLAPNLDQEAQAFFQDVVLTMFENGNIAIVPTETDLNPNVTGGYDVYSMRVGTISEWMPTKVRVNVYNERKGRREDLPVEKKWTPIIENPFFSVMNEPSSTLQRLIRKLSILDTVDEAAASGKLDVIIQLPYTIRSESRRRAAEERRRDIETQLKNTTYGIAYADAAEKIVQLNRPVENNLLGQVEFLVKLLYSQLGLTESVMDGTADEATMINYYNRTVIPVAIVIVQAMRRTFLTKTARTQNQSVVCYRDPFKLVPMAQIAEIADKLTRNEILTSNEFRQLIGFRPFDDPKANELRNSNMPQSELRPEPTDNVVPIKKTAEAVE